MIVYLRNVHGKQTSNHRFRVLTVFRRHEGETTS
jgi:hypothetical protein